MPNSSQCICSGLAASQIPMIRQFKMEQMFVLDKGEEEEDYFIITESQIRGQDIICVLSQQLKNNKVDTVHAVAQLQFLKTIIVLPLEIKHDDASQVAFLE